jgi:hypothetical protein
MGKNGVKILIIVVALGGAAVAYVLGNKSEKLPADAVQPTQVDLICLQCNEHSQDTAENLAKVEIKGGMRTPAEGEKAIRRLAKIPSKYPCPKCGAPEAVHAFYCKDHNIYYPAESPDGGRGKCPQCP